MYPLLLAQTPALFSQGSLWLWVAVLLGGIGLFTIQASLGFQKRAKPAAAIGTLCILAALAMHASQQAMTVEHLLLLAFGWIAVFGAVGFVSFRQPVHAALGFAVAVLASCGIFMMQSAPFIAAATTIVYAGATIIIFLFVLMFAQQSHLQAYELKFAAPKMSILVGMATLAVLLWALQTFPTTVPSETSTARVADLGKSLFGEFLWTVELAGTLLLVATIGAIVIAQRDSASNESTRPESSSGSKS